MRIEFFTSCLRPRTCVLPKKNSSACRSFIQESVYLKGTLGIIRTIQFLRDSVTVFYFIFIYFLWIIGYKLCDDGYDF